MGASTMQSVFKFDLIKPRDATSASLHVCKSQQFFNVLFFWRSIAFILSLGACIGNATHQLGLVDKQREFFLSFTNLCFLFLTIYFLVATLFSFADWRRKRYAYFVSVPGGNSTTESLLFGSNTLSEEDDADPVEVKTPVIYKIFWVMFEIAFTMSVYVDLIFWLTLTTTGHLDTIVVILHGLNGLLMIGELSLNSMVFVPGHVIFIWIVLLSYLVEVWIWAAVDHVWAFSVLDFYHNGVLVFVYYPALFITATVTFFIGYFLVKIRDRKKHVKAYRNIQHDDTFVF